MDLRIQPPRRPSNPAVAGMVGVARMADKARAQENGALGEYLYGADSGQDLALLEFLGISAQEFQKAALEMDDCPLGAWVLERSRKTHDEIMEFNERHVNREPETERMKALLKERVARFAPGRTDIRTAFQSQELDDWGSYREKDLTAGPPRSPYCRDVAGIVALARLAEKARASRCGRLGEYKYGVDSPTDAKVLGWLGLSQDEFAEASYRNPNDKELGAWVLARIGKASEEIADFNRWAVSWGPDSEDEKAYLSQAVSRLDPGRKDIQVWFQLLDLDDEKSFGILDLRRHAPRSAYRTDVLGIAGLARMIDKARASNSGTLGEYWYGEESGIDRRVLEFLRVSSQQFAEALKARPGDEDLASWVRDRCPMSPQEIVDHNDQVVILGPTNERQWDYLKRTVTQLDPSTRDKITTWLDLMDLDDRVTFQRLRSGR